MKSKHNLINRNSFLVCMVWQDETIKMFSYARTRSATHNQERLTITLLLWSLFFSYIINMWSSFICDVSVGRSRSFTQRSAKAKLAYWLQFCWLRVRMSLKTKIKKSSQWPKERGSCVNPLNSAKSEHCPLCLNSHCRMISWVCTFENAALLRWEICIYSVFVIYLFCRRG